MATAVEQRIFSVADCHRMAEAAILTQDERVELIAGKIIVRSPIGSRHAACVKRLYAALSRQASSQVLVSIQDPIQLNDDSD